MLRALVDVGRGAGTVPLRGALLGDRVGADERDPGPPPGRGRLGGALARPAPNSVPYREGRFLVRLLTVGDRTAARAVLDPAFALLAPVTTGRALNFAFGAGDRTEGLYDAGTRKRLAELKARYDPANLFRANYNVGM